MAILIFGAFIVLVGCGLLVFSVWLAYPERFERRSGGPGERVVRLSQFKSGNRPVELAYSRIVRGRSW